MQNKKITFLTLDPGHFHAALVQKNMYNEVNPQVYVYAPFGPDLQQHLERIHSFNTRAENPTKWQTEVFSGPDFFEHMINDKNGNVVVLSGNNQKKTEYILESIKKGFHVYADKPMAINSEDFKYLEDTFQTAAQKNLLLYDIMTERFEINTILQKELSLIPTIFGTLQKGSPGNPAVTKESVHHFYKYVSGEILTRPAWFFDVTQEGEGIVDVTTHLVDLIQWECFPDQVLDYTKDITINSARRWTTDITLEQFNAVTKMDTFPGYLKKDVEDGKLKVYCNGEINYMIKDIYAKVSVAWAYKAPEGTGDTHFSIMRGTKANLVIRQGKEQNYKPTLYIEPVSGKDNIALEAFKSIQQKYSGVELLEIRDVWKVVIPQKYHTGHEAHFAQVTNKFIEYLQNGNIPQWEVSNMIAKYYTTTKALELAKMN